MTDHPHKLNHGSRHGTGQSPEFAVPDEVWRAVAEAAEPVELDARTDPIVARCVRAALAADRGVEAEHDDGAEAATAAEPGGDLDTATRALLTRCVRAAILADRAFKEGA